MTQRGSLPAAAPGSAQRRRWFLWVSGALLLCVMVAARGVLLPFVLAVLVAYVLSPVVEAGERVRIAKRAAPRWVVVLAMYLTLVALIVGVSWVSTPRLIAELGRLSKEVPGALRTVRDEWLPEVDREVRALTAPYLPATPPKAAAITDRPPAAAVELRPRAAGGYELVLPPHGVRVVREGERGYRIEAAPSGTEPPRDFTSALRDAALRATRDTENSTASLLRAGQTFVAQLASLILGFVLTLVMSAYLLITRDQIFAFARSLYSPAKRADFDELMRRIDRGLAGVVRGQLTICLINGVLSGIGFYILDVPYWVFLTLIATVGSLIPIFGSILSTIPAVLVALPQGIGSAMLVLAWIVGIHQLEANVLNPKVLGDSARVHPVLVIFALLAGEHLAGLAGALLAVPVLSIAQTLFLYLRERYLGVPRSSSMPPQQPPQQPPHSAGAGDAKPA